MPPKRYRLRGKAQAVKIQDRSSGQSNVAASVVSPEATDRLRSRTRDSTPSKRKRTKTEDTRDSAVVTDADMQIADNHVTALSNAYTAVLSKHLGIDYLDGKGSDLSRIKRIEDLCSKELYYTTINYDGTNIAPGETRARSFAQAINVRRTDGTNFGPLPTGVPDGTLLNFTAYVHKVEVKGWPFGIPSIQGTTFHIIRSRGDDTLNDVINLPGWGFGQGNNENGFGMFFDPTRYDVLTTTMSLSRDPVFQGVDQYLDFSEDPLKMTYRLRRNVAGPDPWVFGSEFNDCFVVIRNTRKTNVGAPDDIVNWLLSCRIWFTVS